VSGPVQSVIGRRQLHAVLVCSSGRALTTKCCFYLFPSPQFHSYGRMVRLSFGLLVCEFGSSYGPSEQTERFAFSKLHQPFTAVERDWPKLADPRFRNTSVFPTT
jgi:hypothetical protein